jgi:hypothetical protein
MDPYRFGSSAMGGAIAHGFVMTLLEILEVSEGRKYAPPRQ